MEHNFEQENTGENKILHEEDLPFEVLEREENGEESEQSEHGTGLEYIPPAPGEEWIEKAMAAVRVYQAIATAGKGPQKLEQERTLRKKKRFLEVFAKNMGTIGIACEKTGIGRTIYYEWMRTDAQFKSMVSQLAAYRDEAVEDELMQLIQKHDGPSIRFFLERTNPKYKNHSSLTLIPGAGDKSFEDLMYSQAEKRRALTTKVESKDA